MVFWVFWVSGGLGPCFTPEASGGSPEGISPKGGSPRRETRPGADIPEGRRARRPNSPEGDSPEGGHPQRETRPEADSRPEADNSSGYSLFGSGSWPKEERSHRGGSVAPEGEKSPPRSGGAPSYRPKMDSRSLVIVRNRHLTVQGKDVRKNEGEEWL